MHKLAREKVFRELPLRRHDALVVVLMVMEVVVGVVWLLLAARSLSSVLVQTVG